MSRRQDHDCQSKKPALFTTQALAGWRFCAGLQQPAAPKCPDWWESTACSFIGVAKSPREEQKAELRRCSETGQGSCLLERGFPLAGKSPGIKGVGFK